MAVRNLWRKDVLLLVNAMPAAVNFVTSLAIAHLYDLGLAGIWFFGKSLCQVLVATQPGFLTSALIADRSELAGRFLSSALFLTLGWFVALAPGVYFWLDYTISDAGIAFLFFLYWVSLVAYTICSLLARYFLLGKALLQASVLDGILSLVCLVILVFSFELFLLASAAKFLLKSIWLVGGAARHLEFQLSRELFRDGWKLLADGGGLAQKAWVSTLCQYGDKVIIGGLASGAMLGAYGVGSSLAIPVTMLASAIFSWSLPYLKNQQDVIFKRTKFYIASFAVLLMFPVGAYIFLRFYGLSGDALKVALIGVFLAVALTAISFVTNMALTKMGSWKAFSLHVGGALTVYTAIWLFNGMGADLETALTLGVVLSISCAYLLTLRYVPRLGFLMTVLSATYLAYLAGSWLWIL